MRITDLCVKCGACEAGCPTGAISEEENKYVIDMEICIECGTCIASCPMEAIVED